MNVTKAEMIITAGLSSQFPVHDMPEIAFAGKSNVGKSSLLNAMLNRKALARTSSQPGKTQTINFYNVQDTYMFVDLPGYGYAKVSKTDRERWGKLIEGYLEKREQLKKIILLIDIRHEVGNNDKMMYDWIKHYHNEVIVVATKMDKIKRSQVQKHLSMIRKGLNLMPEDKLVGFSSETKQGKEELWKIIEEIQEMN
ncbi:ribosome biogenesis GTP-binding protein YihA/YsxC [Cellulosilyticum sp. ST5]|uniref:Probable GTP-binding protein EngB n=1 Tax=Cellulosilyticum lentocellum (strain ATCC 49066 / DSM 5427 / NCIMB 11756 / RHM5) TaxID=642492 RepID=F2JSM3_CELLD|nr:MULTISPECIES: ribosome biogenesis GTP-binding protein YihA/YsxC [Cellulosilyticum]ADZ82857.1 ribosome biogenesis GTP-binding protein YsxC [Cellulosilyticum lentocellum DSM 5427]QEH68398.1 YihA family ribosome biogenesis GTP-binding protein [Cellulosilyticum sp. WCF-2]